MNKSLVRITAIILVLSVNAHIVGMQSVMHYALQKDVKKKVRIPDKAIFKFCSSLRKVDVKLLEYGREVEGASLLKQNKYFSSYYASNLPTYVSRKRLDDLSESIQDSLVKGFEGSYLSKLPPELQWQMLEGLDNLFDIQYVNKNVLKAVKNICTKNFLMACNIPQDKAVSFLISHHVPIAFVNAENVDCSGAQFGALVPHRYDFHFFPGYDSLSAQDAFIEVVKTIDMKRWVQAWKGYENEKQRMVLIDIDFNKAIICGNSFIVRKYKYRHSWGLNIAIQLFTKYSLNDQSILEYLLKELIRALNKDLNNNLCCNTRFKGAYTLLCVADKYNNSAVFDRLVNADPYDVKNRCLINRVGLSETFLDFVFNNGSFCAENIQKLRDHGYPATLKGAIVGAAQRTIRFFGF